MSTEEVLDLIDAAISDWQVGPDAVRCNGPEVAAGRLQLGDIDLSGQTMSPWPPPVPLQVTLVADASNFERKLRAAAEQIAEVFAANLPALQAAIVRFMEHQRTKRRRPRNGPDPLAIDGHAYRRRTKGRSRR